VDALELEALWSRIEPAVVELSSLPPRGLSSSIWASVAAGKVARLPAATGAAGVGLIAASKAAVWLSVTDDDPVDTVAGLHLLPLEGAWASEKFLYQLLDLPWPFQDRHWVAHGRNNLALSQRTGAWERSWNNAPERLPGVRERLASAGIDPALYDGAMAVPRNRGAWLLVEVAPRQTLGFYLVDVALGGGVPESAAEAYSASTIDTYFRSVEKNALSMPVRYGPGCRPQPAPDGTPIPCFGG
jgi:hypothetical protein